MATSSPVQLKPNACLELLCTGNVHETHMRLGARCRICTNAAAGAQKRLELRAPNHALDRRRPLLAHVRRRVGRVLAVHHH